MRGEALFHEPLLKWPSQLKHWPRHSWDYVKRTRRVFLNEYGRRIKIYVERSRDGFLVVIESSDSRSTNQITPKEAEVLRFTLSAALAQHPTPEEPDHG